MTYPALTAFYAGLFALIYLGLAACAVASRASSGTLHGDGDGENAALEKRIRTQGYFGEYVPLALILVVLLDAAAPRRWCGRS